MKPRPAPSCRWMTSIAKPKSRSAAAIRALFIAGLILWKPQSRINAEYIVHGGEAITTRGFLAITSWITDRLLSASERSQSPNKPRLLQTGTTRGPENNSRTSSSGVRSSNPTIRLRSQFDSDEESIIVSGSSTPTHWRRGPIGVFIAAAGAHAQGSKLLTGRADTRIAICLRTKGMPEKLSPPPNQTMKYGANDLVQMRAHI